MLKRTVLMSYVGQVYAALIALAAMPFYLHYLGAEAFGLVGFYVMLQAWAQLLDMGLTPALSRELSRYRAGDSTATDAWALVRMLEWLFGVVAVLFAALAFLARDWVALGWLHPDRLPPDEVALSIAIMGAMVGMRWLVGLYRGGLVGLEEQVRLQAAGMLIATLKAVGVLLALGHIEASARVFFLYQGVVAIAELLLFMAMFYKAMPRSGARIYPRWGELRQVGHFAGGMAFLSAMWVAIMQVDKLVLSRALSLADYGYFSLAVTVASGVMLLSAPLHQAVQPRFAILAIQGQELELTRLYRIVTQFTVALMCALAGTMALFAEPLLLAWTGDAEAARRAGPILFWYALGNGIAGLLAVPFLLQYAYGKLRLHIIANAIFGLFWLPAVIYTASAYGAVGTGVAWLLGNLIFLLIWPIRVHACFMPALSWAWLGRDVGLVALVVAVGLFVARWIDLSAAGRLQVLLTLMMLTLGLVAIGMLAGDRSRRFVLSHLRGA